MKSGSLRNHFITIKKPSIGKSDYGSETEDWSILYPMIRASVTNYSGNRVINQDAIHPINSYTVTLRRNFKKDLTHNCKVIYNDREYIILSIDDDKDNNCIILNITLAIE